MSVTKIERFKRYPVAGRILFQSESVEANGRLVDIGKWGALIRSEIKPFEGEETTARLYVHDYSRVIQVRGMVLRVQSDSWSMMFLEKPVGLAKLLRWLERT